jgi:hypothetical protein
MQRRRKLGHNVLALAHNYTVSEGSELPQDDDIGLYLQGGVLRVELCQGKGKFHFHVALDDAVPTMRSGA